MEELIIYENESKGIISKASSLEVNNEPSSKLATDIGVTLSKILKEVETKRKFLVKPAQETVSRVNAEAKKISAPIELALDIIRDKQKSYLLTQRKQQEQENEEKAKILEEFSGEEITAPKVKTQSHGQAGSSFMKKRWTFRIIDITKIPKDYMQPNEPKIRQALRDNLVTIKGVQKLDFKIEGVEFYQEDEVAFK